MRHIALVDIDMYQVHVIHTRGESAKGENVVS